MKKYASLVLLLVLALCLTSCASEEDKALAAKVSSDISALNSVSLENSDEIYAIVTEYNSLADRQKKLVSNSDTLQQYASELRHMIEEEEAKKDPTYNVKKSDLSGIWANDNADSRRGYFWFTPSGYVYYMASKSEPASYDFTSEYMMATSFDLGAYNYATKSRTGSFYCVPTKSDMMFTVSTDSGGIYLEFTNRTASGTYHKTDIELVAKVCAFNGCAEDAVTTGYSIYCVKHSNRCLECGEYVDNDALYCVDCILSVLLDNSK